MRLVYSSKSTKTLCKSHSERRRMELRLYCHPDTLHFSFISIPDKMNLVVVQR